MCNKLLLALFSICLVSCAGEMTKEIAAEAIAAQSEFQQPFYAPMHFVNQVLTGENHSDPKAYINRKYGELVAAELIETKLGASNSWRTILKIGLTEKGLKMEDKTRSLDDMSYVQACNMRVDSILSLEPLGKDTMLCRYSITQCELTPFGRHLGFVEGRSHLHERKFVRSTFAWDLVSIK